MAKERNMNMDMNQDMNEIKDSNLGRGEKQKTGLDVENGRYKVTGVVTTRKVFKRRPNKQGISTNIVPHPVGYRMEDLHTGNVRLVEKNEGVIAVGKNGAVNSYVMIKDNSDLDENGEVIKERINCYLQPHPPRSEAFTQDDRIVNVFEYDENGDIKEDPLTLTIKEEDCTERLWNIIEDEYKKKLEKAKNKRRVTENEVNSQEKAVKEAFQRFIDNSELDFKI